MNRQSKCGGDYTLLLYIIGSLVVQYVQSSTVDLAVVGATAKAHRNVMTCVYS